MTRAPTRRAAMARQIAKAIAEMSPGALDRMRAAKAAFPRLDLPLPVEPPCSMSS